MKKIDTLILGAGVTGLSTACWLNHSNYLILEADSSVGGYCKTTISDDFVWDYSGHFFHFKNDFIKSKLLKNIQCDVIDIQKISKIYYNNIYIDFPFQNNIHQLNKDEFLECLVDLYNCNKESTKYNNFKEFVYGSLGQSISDKFIIPYNEKLYACGLNELDVECMGRFFPKVRFDNVMNSIGGIKYESYNDTFIYPVGGAYEFIKSICVDVEMDNILLNETVVSVDLEEKIVTTTKGKYIFNSLVSTIPFDRLLNLTGNDTSDFNYNKVVVFNIGFDLKSTTDSHWIYFPGDEIFYRVGFYDNILDGNQMSIYVEIALSKDDIIDEIYLYNRVIGDLKRVGIVTEHIVIDYQMLVLSPAYVHITKNSKKIYEDWCSKYNPHSIYSIGRYGSWTYCSIEDNIIQSLEVSNSL